MGLHQGRGGRNGGTRNSEERVWLKTRSGRGSGQWLMMTLRFQAWRAAERETTKEGGRKSWGCHT